MSDFDAAVEAAERAQVITDLKAVRKELVTRGRCNNGKFLDENTGRVCILGAISVATTHTELTNQDVSRHAYEERPTRVRRALEEHFDQNRAIFLFNDDYRTTDQDVLNLIDKTLADLGGLS